MPPKNLFSLIIKRLRLEKEIALIKNNLRFFSVLLVIFVFLSFFTFMGLKNVLEESNFGSFFSLIFSDPKIVIKYWHSFVFAVFETIPGIMTGLLFLFLAFLLFFARFITIAIEKLFITIKSINRQKYGHK